MTRKSKRTILGLAFLCVALGGILVLRAAYLRTAPPVGEQMSAEEGAAWDALVALSVSGGMGMWSRKQDQESLAFLLKMQQQENFLARLMAAFSSDSTEEQIRELQRKVEAPIREADLSSISAAVAPHLAQLQSLRRISFFGGDLRGPVFAAVSQITHLEKLRVVNSELLPADLEQLRNLQHLTELDVMLTLISEKEDSRQKLLGELSSDEQQQLEDYLRRHPKSKSRSIELAIIADRSIVKLRELKSLRTLSIINSPISNVGLASIAQLPSLEKFDLQFLEFDAETVRLIASMRNLRGLARAELNDEHLRELSQLPRLESLSAYAAEVTSVGIERLAGMSTLQFLNLDGIPINDEQLLQLAALPELKTLILQSHRGTLTPEGIAKFQELKPQCKLIWK